jgi:hypothetical protein
MTEISRAASGPGNVLGRLIRSGLAIATLMLAASVAAEDSAEAGWPQAATDEDLSAARDAFLQWVAAYRSGDFELQWRLTDKRIRHWFDKKRWRSSMSAAQRRNGELERFEILAQAPIDAEQLPCTEQRHCYRRGVRYVIFLVGSGYAAATPPQPEYAAMALSDEGWKFGGGTFPNRPLGETAVILTESDERRYRYKGLE